MSYQSDERPLAVYFRSLENLRRNWGWFLLLGIALIALGIAAIYASTATTLVTVWFLGALLLASGIINIIYAFWAHKWSGFFLSLLVGIIYALLGLAFLNNPMIGALTLTLLLAAFFVVSGLFRIIYAVALRFEHWGWVVLSGIIALVLGALIYSQWPISGLWVIGLFIGIDLIFYGWTWVIISLAARNFRLK